MDSGLAADSEETRSGDVETEDDLDDHVQLAPRAAPHRSSRSRATSPSASAPSDSAAAAAYTDEGYARLTARQRARMEKEAGIAEDVAWHEMELLPNLTYTWKGKGTKEANQMTEQEWLKRQEQLERRRMRSIRDKREAEEAVKAKIRRAVTARFRGKLGGDSGMDGQGGAGDQDGGSVRPGYVKMRYRAQGVTVGWHPAVHPLSLPVPVSASASVPQEPIELPLQPPAQGQPWRVPPSSCSSFKTGCKLVLQPGQSTDLSMQQPPAGFQQQHMQQQPQVVLHAVDSQGWAVGCLLQQQVLEALEFEGLLPPEQQQQQQAGASHTAGSGDWCSIQAAVNWQHWQASVRSIKRSAGGDLSTVVVRLVKVS